jgi:hypothetical protein
MQQDFQAASISRLRLSLSVSGPGWHLWMVGMLTWYLVELPKPVEANNV